MDEGDHYLYLKMLLKIFSSSLKGLVYGIFDTYPLFYVTYILENHPEARDMHSTNIHTPRPREKYKIKGSSGFRVVHFQLK